MDLLGTVDGVPGRAPPCCSRWPVHHLAAVRLQMPVLMERQPLAFASLPLPLQRFSTIRNIRHAVNGDELVLDRCLVRKKARHSAPILSLLCQITSIDDGPTAARYDQLWINSDEDGWPKSENDPDRNGDGQHDKNPRPPDPFEDQFRSGNLARAAAFYQKSQRRICLRAAKGWNTGDAATRACRKKRAIIGHQSTE